MTTNKYTYESRYKKTPLPTNTPLSNPYYFLKQQKPSPSSTNKKPSHTNGSLHDDDPLYIRKDFPILTRKVNGKKLIWLDNSATTQKPQAVINALNHYYTTTNSNVHRGAHALAKESTDAYEKARSNIRAFIGARSSNEIIFTRGATEAINLVAMTYGYEHINKGDEILLSTMEHHSNIVPWQKIADEKGATLKPIPIDQNGDIILEEYEKMFNEKTKMVGITHVSNILGTVNPVATMVQIAHKHGVCVLIDGAQSAPHLPVDVCGMDADFFVFSGHKLYGPTGIGVLYGKKHLLDEMVPWQRGGGMIKDVTFERSIFHDPPGKFEAGTGNIADAIGLSAAIDYIRKIGPTRIEQHEKELTTLAMKLLSTIKGIHLIGTSQTKTSVIAFAHKSISPDTFAKALNNEGIAIRSGHHCAQPTLRHFGYESCARASIGMYNTPSEIRYFAECVKNIVNK